MGDPAAAPAPVHVPAGMPPAFAAQLAERFRWTKHHLLGTIRSDGSPRISGTEVTINADGWWIGSMLGARKVADLRRDPRGIIHSAPQPADEQLSDGDAKVSFTAIDASHGPEFDAYVAYLTAAGTPPPPEPFDVFRLDIHEASIVTVAGDELVIRVWSKDYGLRTIRRR